MMGALAGLMKDRDRLQEVGQRVKANLEAARVLGEAGGGAVRVTASGLARVIDVELDPSMVATLGADDESQRLAESLIAEATNDALKLAQMLMQKEAAAAAEELGLPELPGLENRIPIGVLGV